MKEKIISVSFSLIPDVRVRVINSEDIEKLKKNKKKFPFELYNTIEVFIKTSKRDFSFFISNGYTWNGADIPRFFWRVIGARTDNDFLIASLIHDYLLEFKSYIMVEILKNTLDKRA